RRLDGQRRGGGEGRAGDDRSRRRVSSAAQGGISGRAALASEAADRSARIALVVPFFRAGRVWAEAKADAAGVAIGAQLVRGSGGRDSGEGGNRAECSARSGFTGGVCEAVRAAGGDDAIRQLPACSCLSLD